MKRAVLIDALGTMHWLQPPWEHADPVAFAGLEPERVRAGFVAEMTYYMAHTDEGRDPEALAELRRRCARVLSDEVGREISVATMMQAIRFQPFPETEQALRALRGAGLKLICVSNWDCSLPDVLERLGLAAALHVGDSDDDVAGARAAGIDVLRIDRAGGGDIASLGEIEEHLRR